MRFERRDRRGCAAGWRRVAAVNVAVLAVCGMAAIAGANDEVELLILRDAAERGDVRAQVEYADRLATGRGAAADVRAALEWWAKAALAGDPDAMVRVADHLVDGRGVAADPAKALALWRRAANRGHAGAMARVARAMESGSGTPANAVEAAAWWRRAAEAGEPSAQYEWGRRLDDGIGVAAAPAEAKTWYERAAQHGVAEAMTAMARLYAEGRVGPPNLREAYVWCLLAERMGDPLARRNCEILSAVLSRFERFRAAREASARARAWGLP